MWIKYNYSLKQKIYIYIYIYVYSLFISFNSLSGFMFHKFQKISFCFCLKHFYFLFIGGWKLKRCVDKYDTYKKENGYIDVL